MTVFVGVGVGRRVRAKGGVSVLKHLCLFEMWKKRGYFFPHGILQLKKFRSLLAVSAYWLYQWPTLLDGRRVARLITPWSLQGCQINTKKLLLKNIKIYLNFFIFFSHNVNRDDSQNMVIWSRIIWQQL